MTGTISFHAADRLFGFITAADGSGERFFFHRTACRAVAGGFDALALGDKVQFEATQGPKGPRAEDVRLIPSHSQA